MLSITLARVTAINYILLYELENGECELEKPPSLVSYSSRIHVLASREHTGF